MSETVTVRWEGALAESRMRTEAVGALNRAGRYLLDKANETVPRLTGSLAESGRYEVDFEKLTVQVIYDEPYALVQHEDTEFHHEGAGRAKWLQLTMQEQAPEVKGLLGEMKL